MFRSFRNRLALYVGLLTLTLGLITASFASTIASAHLKRATNQYLHSVASSIANAMTSLIEERQREVSLLSEHPLLTRAQVSADQVRIILNQMGNTYKHYSWIGFASTNGEVLVAKDSLLEGKNVSQRPWFKEGLTKSFVGDVHEAVMLSTLLDTKGTEPLRFIDVASPVRKEDGTIRGVIATHINWAWVDELLQNALPSAQEHIEAYVVTGNGDVLYPYSAIGQLQFPTALLGKEATLSFEHDDTIYLSASSQVLASQKTSLDWYVIIRQPKAIALASIKTLHWQIFIASFVFVAFAVFVAFRLASRFSKPIEILAIKASRVEAGDETQQFRQPSNIR